MTKKISVVVAHKYNDIYYGINTEEFKDSDIKILITVEKGSLKSTKFPFQDHFDKCFCITKRITVKTLLILVQFFFYIKVIGKVSAVFFSNPLLVINQFIQKGLGYPSTILLEDGLMNYCEVNESLSGLKRISQKFLQVSTSKFCGNILITYLNKPESAKYFFGKAQKIELCDIGLLKEFHVIYGKKIFVGGDYYRYGFMTIHQYCIYVNDIIVQYNIDYYLPHPFASNKEVINCTYLDLGSKSVTLEMLAGKYKFSIFSFGSTCSFTCKNINTDIETVFFVLEEYSNVVFQFLQAHSDKVIYVK